MNENLKQFNPEQAPMLSELMEEENPAKVRIGTQGSGGFVYIGDSSDLYGEKLWHVNRDMKRLHDQQELKQRVKVDRDIELIRTGKLAVPSTGMPVYREKKYVPMMERKVVEAYDSCVDDDRVYIIQGFEKLLDYNPDLQTDPEKLNNDRVRETIEGVYKDSLNNLAKAYRRLMKAKTIKEMMYAAEDAQKEEGWLKLDTWEILNGSAEGMIRTARQIVEKEIREEQEGKDADRR